MAPTRRLTSLLCTHSYFSFGAGVASPKRLAALAAERGFTALGLADDASVAGVVELAREAKRHGLKPVYGTTVPIKFQAGVFPLVLIAGNRAGYRTLCELLTVLAAGEEKALDLKTVLDASSDLYCLTGPRTGILTHLLGVRRPMEAVDVLRTLRGTFRDRLLVQLTHDLAPSDRFRAGHLRALAMEAGVRVVAAPEVRLLSREDRPLLDALVCSRLGITVEEDHPARPRNGAQHLWTPETWGRRIPYPEALSNASALVRDVSFDLLPGELTPPEAHVPMGYSPLSYLCERAVQGFGEKYGERHFQKARDRLEQELRVVEKLRLEEFFLVAMEITDYCRAHGILASGRGSAAASVLCHVLGITGVDPVEHDLLFERFLHTGRVGTPDIDLDIGSQRRRQVIAWVEERWGESAEAMVSNRTTYRLPLAIQDLGRALGVTKETRDLLTRKLGRDYEHLRPHRAREAETVLDEVLGSAPVKEQLLSLLERMEPEFVRHLTPHSGGVVLSREDLRSFSPLGHSTGGIKVLAFDKDDVESLGLIKIDLLGLSMLSALERAREEVMRLTGEWTEFDRLPDDPEVWERIAVGDTLGLFQVESPGQQRLSVQLKARNLRELAHQVALFRPGPIQSGTVHPYVRRTRGLERVPPLDEPLRSILGPTQGVLLFQEQVLRLAVRYAGMDWPDADRFRKRLSDTEDKEEVAELRALFVRGAVETCGVREAAALGVFEMCAAFRGYGFAESHAWSFAAHAYSTAWMRHHHAGPFLAGVLAEHTGMWPVHTIAAEARKWGVRLAPVDVNRSGVHHRAEDGRTVRMPLCAVAGVSEDAARGVVLERLARGPFRSVDELYHRVRLGRDVLEALIRAGALEGLGSPRRDALFRLTQLANAAPPGRQALLTPAESAPEFLPLSAEEQLVADFATKGVSEDGRHPLDLVRGELRSLACTPLARTRHGERVRTAGLIIARQKPPTAKGCAFFVLEDRGTRLQIMIVPELWEAHRQLLRDARALIVEGVLEHTGDARALRAERLAELDVTVGVRGYAYA